MIGWILAALAATMVLSGASSAAEFACLGHGDALLQQKAKVEAHLKTVQTFRVGLTDDSVHQPAIATADAAIAKDRDALALIEERLRLCPPQAPTDSSVRCKDLSERIDQMKTVASRANLADDVYNLYDEPQRGWLAPWKAPRGYTLLSNDIHVLRQMMPGLKASDIGKLIAPPDSAYRAAIYTDQSKGTLFLVFRGTTDGTMDWTGGNLPNKAGLGSDYFRKAADLGGELKTYANANNFHLEIIGHSLGGGMASWAGAKDHVPATVFNAENVKGVTPSDQRDIENAGDWVTNYVVPHEAVTAEQTFSPAPGKMVTLPDWPGSPLDPVERHRMRSVRLAVQNQLDELKKDFVASGCAP